MGLDNGLAPNRQQAIIWTNDDPVQRRIYTSLCLNELISVLSTPTEPKFECSSLKIGLRNDQNAKISKSGVHI